MADSARRGVGRRWLNALIVVLIIPVVALAISLSVSAKYQSDLYAAIESNIGRSLTPAERADRRIQVDAICADPTYSGDPLCTDIVLASLTKVVAIVGGAVGLALLALVAFLRARTTQDRDALLRLFRPGLYLTLVGLSTLVLLDGALAVSSVYLGLGVFLGRVYPILILAIALGALVAVVGIVRATLRASRPAVANVIGRRVDPGTQPQLMGLVRDLASSVGTEPPDHVLVGLDPSFYVSEVDTQAIDGRWRGRSLYLSLPLSQILSVEELRAVVGHEMGHFRGSDTAYSRRFYPIYAGASGAITALVGAGAGSGARSLALIPAAYILGLFMDAFAPAERSISRDRELAADKAGAAAASPSAVGSALAKLTAFSGFWGKAVDALIRSVRAGTPIANASEAFVGFVHGNAAFPSVAQLDNGRIPHPTDSHPPLSDRIAALGVSAESVEQAAKDIDPAERASSVIADASVIEADLTTWIEGRMAARMPASASKAPAGKAAR